MLFHRHPANPAMALQAAGGSAKAPAPAGNEMASRKVPRAADLEDLPKLGSALGCSDVLDNSCAAANGSDGNKVHTNDCAGHRHVLDGHLHI